MYFIAFIVLIPALLGVVYPAIYSATYPIYKRLGGKMSYKRYMSNI